MKKLFSSKYIARVLILIGLSSITVISYATIQKHKTTTTNTQGVSSIETQSKEEKILEQTPEESAHEITVPTILSTTLFGSGHNDHGQLAMRETQQTAAFAASETDIVFTDIALGRNHSVGLSKDGAVYTWGDNREGQLGYTTDHTANPTPHLVFKDARAIGAAQNHTIILKKDGTVWSFGSNFTAQLGDGTNTNRTTPVKVEGLPKIVDIATGYKFILAITKNGEVYGWGASCAPSHVRVAADMAARLNSLDGGYYDPILELNPNGYDRNQDCLLEDVVGIQSKVPKKIDISDVVSASVGYGHALMLKRDGTVWSFGCNLYGQMGNRTYNNRVDNARPQEIIGLKDIQEVSAGFRHSLALGKDGTVYAWGMNSFTEKQSFKNSTEPVKIDMPHKIVHIIDGYDVSFAIDAQGTSYAWGSNVTSMIPGAPETLFTPFMLPEKIRFLAVGIAHLMTIR